MAEKITVNEVRYIVYRLVKQYYEWSEPIPEFSARVPGVLESCLATPFQSFSGNEFYPELVDKAAILFYLMIKNHPFQNGNKRLAIFTLMWFLNRNSTGLNITPNALYLLALDVAASKPEEKDSTVNLILSSITNNIIHVSITDN